MEEAIFLHVIKRNTVKKVFFFSNTHLKHHSNAHNMMWAFAVYKRSSHHIVLC